jgi:hypothetical protein
MAACNIASPGTVAAQLSRGETVYRRGCAIAACHGEDGEGIRSNDHFQVWPLVGREFQSRNPSAQVIFDVVRSGGEKSLRALTDQQIYDAIAYELSLNGVSLSEPIVADNAPFISSGSASAGQPTGTLFPPAANITMLTGWDAPALPVSAEDAALRIRLTQIRLASSIGGKAPPGGGSYVLTIFTLEDLTDHPIEVGPQYLSLVTKKGEILKPLEINLGYPVTRFYPQSIRYEHGTAALAIFALPDISKMEYLLYAWPGDQPLVLFLAY